MDANARRQAGARGGRTAAVALAVVGLVVIVAIASGGSTPRGTIGAHRPSEGLLNAVISLFVVGMGVATVLVAVMLSFFGRYTPDGTVRKRRSPVQSVVTFIVAIVVLTVVVRVLGGERGAQLRSALQPRGEGSAGSPDGGGGRYQPEFVLWPVLLVGVLALVALAGWYLAARGRRSASAARPATPQEALVDVLSETLDDLRAERDPRRAVIAAYARMERALAASGLPRSAAEAPEEYLERVLEEVAASRRSAGRLTALFAWARFSGHDVRPEMKEEAIETLEQVQRELAADEAARAAAASGESRVSRLDRTVAAAITATIWAGVFLVVLPGKAAVVGHVWLVVVLALSLGVALERLRRAVPRRPSSFDAAFAPGRRAHARPASLARVEREVTLASGTAFDVHFRLRPLLQPLTAGLLLRRGVDLERDPARAAALLGPDLWELVRPDRAAPDDRTAPGLPPADVERAIDRLELLAWS